MSAMSIVAVDERKQLLQLAWIFRHRAGKYTEHAANFHHAHGLHASEDARIVRRVGAARSARPLRVCVLRRRVQALTAAP
eukprot:3652203-Pleurochrysis_carterae.AAC.1